jgi:hypothetical protein
MNVMMAGLELLMRILVAVCVSNFALHGFMAYETFQFLSTLYIIVPVTAFFFARRFLSTHPKLMMIVHVLFALSVIPAVHASVEETFVVFLVVLVFMFISLQAKSQEPVVPADVGVILLCFLLSGTMKSASAALIPAYSAIAYVICFFIHLNLKNVNSFLCENAQVRSFRADQALNVNVVMMAFFMLFCMFFMFLAPRLHIQTVLSAAGRTIGGAIIWLLSMLDVPTGGYELEFSNPNQTITEEDSGSGVFLLGTGEGSVILDTIAAVAGVILLIGLAVLAVAAIRRIRFEKVSGHDRKEFIRPEFMDIRVERAEHKKEREIFGSTNERVRKKYKRFVKKNKGKTTIIRGNEVPEYLTKLANGTDEMTRIYEKARYSNEIVTEEEVKQI